MAHADAGAHRCWLACCSHRAPRRKIRRDSNRRWMKVQVQVTTISPGKASDRLPPPEAYAIPLNASHSQGHDATCGSLHFVAV